jgi:hypothetical protein
MAPRDSLAILFNEQLQLPRAAIDWLLNLWDVSQLFDDVADKTPIDREALDRAIFASLVQMPANPFFAANSTTLLPLLATVVLKWKASDDAELEGKADERSFVWRAGYYDMVLGVVLLCHGPDVAMKAAKLVMSMYGESFADYSKEFNHG